MGSGRTLYNRNKEAVISRKIVLSLILDFQSANEMDTGENKKENHRDQIIELNQILEELLVDARELVGDLLSGISMTFVMGVVGVILGVQTLWYNRHYITSGDYIPLLLAIAIMASGALIILRGLTLRSKYSKLHKFKSGDE